MPDSERTRDGDDLALVDIQIERRGARNKLNLPQPHIVAEVAGERYAAFALEVAADHVSDGEREVERPRLGKDLAPVAKHDDPVGDAADIPHPMRDVQDADALAAQPIDDRKEPVGLRCAKARGRLVENEHRGIGGNRARDRDKLPLRRPKRAEILVERNVEPDMRRDLLGSPADPVASGRKAESAAAKLVKHQILGDRYTCDAQLVGRLVDRDDPAFARAPWRCETDFASADKDRPLVRPMDAGGDPRQRRLSRPICAQEGNDLAFPDREVDVVERKRRTEALRELLKRERSFRQARIGLRCRHAGTGCLAKERRSAACGTGAVVD